LKARAQELREEIHHTEAELAGRRKSEAEAPGRLVDLWRRVFNHEIPEAEPERFAAEGRLLSLRPQLSALDGAVAAAEDSAQHAAATALQEAYRAEAATLLKSYEAVAASSARMHAIYG
jgi:hypothetical protein